MDIIDALSRSRYRERRLNNDARQTDRQTNKQTDEQMDIIDALSRSRYRERRLNNDARQRHVKQIGSHCDLPISWWAL